ncbi:MAG: hypothetical protein LBL65_01115 [Campylobacteraceae bacterium]|jgi:hypothetical protein|nr:hypothetical protein [Campylobacteraceae bacterium]
MGKKSIFKAILLKERIKLQKLFWLPFVIVIAVSADVYMSYKSVIASHGAAELWIDLVYKQSIYFDKFKWALIAGGMLFAYLQFAPECKSGRLRLMFHLPTPYRLSIYSIIFIGVILNIILSLTAIICLFLVSWMFHFPYELIFSMLMSVVPWSIAGIVSYLAVSSIIAESSIVRKLALAFICVIFISLLTTTNGFFSIKSDLGLYALTGFFWLFSFEAAALRIKERVS